MHVGDTCTNGYLFPRSHEVAACQEAQGIQSGEHLGWTVRSWSHLARDGEKGASNRGKVTSKRAKVTGTWQN